MLLNKLSSRLSWRNSYTFWNSLSLVLLGAMAASLLISTFFIQRNIYQTLDDANSIVVLSASPDIEVVDIALFEQIERVRSLKNVVRPVPPNLRYPFQYVSSSPAVVPSLPGPSR